MEKYIGELHSGNRDFKLLFHLLQNSGGKIIAFPGSQILQAFLIGLQDRALLHTVNRNGYMDRQTGQGIVCQLMQHGLIHIGQNPVHPGQNIIV